MDLAELTQRAREGKPLYGESDQPDWVQAAAHRNSAFSQLKFREWPVYHIVANISEHRIADAFPMYVKVKHRCAALRLMNSPQAQPRQPPVPWHRPNEIRCKGRAEAGKVKRLLACKPTPTTLFIYLTFQYLSLSPPSRHNLGDFEALCRCDRCLYSFFVLCASFDCRL